MMLIEIEGQKVNLLNQNDPALMNAEEVREQLIQFRKERSDIDHRATFLEDSISDRAMLVYLKLLEDRIIELTGHSFR